MKEQKTKRNSFSLFSSLSLSLTVRGPRGLGLVKLLVEGPVRDLAGPPAVLGELAPRARLENDNVRAVPGAGLHLAVGALLLLGGGSALALLLGGR